MPFLTLILCFTTWLAQSLCGFFRAWTKPITETPLVGAATDMTRGRRELILENTLLRQQLLVLRRQVKRPKLGWRDRTMIVVIASP